MLNFNNPSSNYDNLFALLKTDLITIYYSSNLKKLIENIIKNEINSFYESFFYQKGVILPAIQFRESITLENNSYNIFIREQYVKTGFILNENIVITRENNDFVEKKCFFEFNVDKHNKSRKNLHCSSATIHQQDIISPAPIFFNDLTHILSFNIDQILTLKYISAIFNSLKQENPTLYKLLKENNINEILVKQIFCSLIQEGLSIKDYEYVLEKLLDHSSDAGSLEQLIDRIRINLKRQINNQFRNTQNKIKAVTLSLEFEEKLIDYFNQYQPYELNNYQRILKKLVVKSTLDQAGKYFEKLNSDPLIITSYKLRRHLFNLLFPYNNFITVLAYEEMMPETRVEILGIVVDKVMANIPETISKNDEVVNETVSTINPEYFILVGEISATTRKTLLDNLYNINNPYETINELISLYENLLQEYIVRIINQGYSYRYSRRAVRMLSEKLSGILINLNITELSCPAFTQSILEEEALKAFDELLTWIEQAIVLEDKFEKS